MAGVVFGEERTNLNTQLFVAGCRCPGLFAKGGQKKSRTAATILSRKFIKGKENFSSNSDDFLAEIWMSLHE